MFLFVLALTHTPTSPTPTPVGQQHHRSQCHAENRRTHFSMGDDAGEWKSEASGNFSGVVASRRELVAKKEG